MKFRVELPNGEIDEVEKSDVDTIDCFVNAHFGSAWPDAEAAGTKVTIIGAEPSSPQDPQDPQD